MVEHLFYGRGYLGEFLRGEEQIVRQNILEMTNEDLKQSNDLLAPLLASKFKKEKLILGSSQKEDLGESPSRFKQGRIAKKFNIKIKFTGDERIFEYCPSRYTLNYPMGEIVDGEIQTIFEFISGDSLQSLTTEIGRNTENIKGFVDNANLDIEGFNDSILTKILQGLDLRRQQLSSYDEAFDAIDCEDDSSTDEPEMKFENPTERIEIEIENNNPEEPFLKEAIFQSITDSVNRIGKSFEQVSPELRNLGEEQIRDFFLSCLKNSYGNLSLTGESFNRKGKTDILIKHENSNLYVSEFKIWSDEPKLSAGITQLLGNLTWRDSKCSYVVFSRIQNFTRVIQNIKEIVSNHGKCIELESEITETSFKFKFKNAQDDDKIVHLNLHLFNIR